MRDLRGIKNAVPGAGYAFVASSGSGWHMAGFEGRAALRSAPSGMDQVYRPEAHEGALIRSAGMSAASLAVRHVTRRYGGVPAVEDVSFDVAPGEIVALVGHSGSGKSTLLRLIAGLEALDAGRIAIGGHDVATPDGSVPPEKRGVGMMFQDYALFPHLTALRNVMFGLRAMPASEARAAALRALARVGLADRGGDYPHMLSGGEQQRVALARALAPRPRILLMDEPFSNLDRRTRILVREDTFGVLRESGTTVVLVTHDQDDAMRVADRIVMMQSGRIVQDGPAEELCQRPATLDVARFFADWNEVPGICRGGSAVTPAGDFPTPSFREGEAVVVCIRPSDIRVGTGDRGGRVVSRHYLGETEMVQVAVDGLSQPLRVVAPSGDGLAVGSPVSFSVKAGDALVFPAD
ncbi:MAG TPA: ABC transporter ATP-binding protein [Bauldia sp.]|nr:ABC transporter ATP-binding protein [Bauldia sp.]